MSYHYTTPVRPTIVATRRHNRNRSRKPGGGDYGSVPFWVKS